MSFSPALKWSIALLLPLTLAWKLTVGPDESAQRNKSIIEFLVRQKFEAVETDLNGMLAIRAAAGMCRILVLRASPIGSDGDLIRDLAAATDRIFTIFRGRVYAEGPNWLIMLGHLKSRFLHRLGLVHHVSSVIAVVASASCDAEQLPWDELRDQ